LNQRVKGAGILVCADGVGKETGKLGLAVGQVCVDVFGNVLVVHKSLLTEDGFKVHDVKGVGCRSLLGWVFLVGVDGRKVIVVGVCGEVVIRWFGWGVEFLRGAGRHGIVGIEVSCRSVGVVMGVGLSSIEHG
jgi:hypothetical protein